MLSPANRTRTKVARIAGVSMLVVGVFLFLFTMFAGMAYPIRGFCGTAISPEYAQPCTEYDPRPEILKPIMNREFAVSAIGLASAGAAILAITELKASKS